MLRAWCLSEVTITHIQHLVLSTCSQILYHNISIWPRDGSRHCDGSRWMWSQLLSTQLSFPERTGLRAPAGRKVLNFPGRWEMSRPRTGLGEAIWGCQERGRSADAGAGFCSTPAPRARLCAACACAVCASWPAGSCQRASLPHSSESTDFGTRSPKSSGPRFDCRY